SKQTANYRCYFHSNLSYDLLNLEGVAAHLPTSFPLYATFDHSSLHRRILSDYNNEIILLIDAFRPKWSSSGSKITKKHLIRNYSTNFNIRVLTWKNTFLFNF
ncbi:hypothetical protein BpHYR1_032059, partial [Brachionus plicatilis]